MNRKGFTLIELLATIILLALVIGISSYAIMSLIKNSKQKNYDLLISNIKDASETYYQECRYTDTSSSVISCVRQAHGSYQVSLGELVNYGYLKGNDTKNDNTYTIVNPLNNESISNCLIAINYQNGKIVVTSLTNTGSCPQDYSGVATKTTTTKPVFTTRSSKRTTVKQSSGTVRTTRTVSPNNPVDK